MPERRMFAKSIVLSDAFLDMPTSARCLYFTLGMFADDDGFINNPKSIMRQIASTEDDLKILLAKKFLIAFEDGVIVIKHWKIHNYIQKDRYVPTKYQVHKELLTFDENNAYTLAQNNSVHEMDTQDKLSKDSIVKDSVDKSLLNDINIIDNTNTSKTSCNLEKKEYNEDKDENQDEILRFCDITDFIEKEQLKTLNPMVEYIHITTLEIEDWKSYLLKKENRI